MLTIDARDLSSPGKKARVSRDMGSNLLVGLVASRDTSRETVGIKKVLRMMH